MLIIFKLLSYLLTWSSAPTSSYTSCPSGVLLTTSRVSGFTKPSTWKTHHHNVKIAADHEQPKRKLQPNIGRARSALVSMRDIIEFFVMEIQCGRVTHRGLQGFWRANSPLGFRFCARFQCSLPASVEVCSFLPCDPHWPSPFQAPQ